MHKFVAMLLLLPIPSFADCIVRSLPINKNAKEWSHSSTLAETPKGLLAAWFSAGEADPKSEIKTALLGTNGWSTPTAAMSGIDASGTRAPVWNPILLNIGSRILLFFKVGPTPQSWWGSLAESTDGGAHFQERSPYPASQDGPFYGPTKSLPLRISGDRWLIGSSTELNENLQSHFEIADDNFVPLKRIEIPNPKNILAIQPTLFRKPNSSCIRALLRTKSGKIGATESCDEGDSWSAIELTDIPNPGSGINAISLQDGGILLAYNDAAKGRNKLAVARSQDGIHFETACRIKQGLPWEELSYPYLLQTADGKVHLSFTNNRKFIEYYELKF